MPNLKEKHCTEFFENIFSNNKYVLENKEVEQHYIVDSILVAIKTGGSSGGNCWGGRTCSFYVDYDDRKKELVETLEYYSPLRDLLSKGDYDSTSDFLNIFKNTAEEYCSSSIASKADYYDYYGNGNDYDIVAIPVFNLMKKILNPEDFSTLKRVYSESKTQEVNELDLHAKIEELTQITDKLCNFEKNSQNNLQNIESNIANLKANLARWENLYTNFKQTTKNEKEALEKRKEELEQEGIVIPAVKTKRFY